jgi:TM2 domain-containing membrane protein YozV
MNYSKKNKGGVVTLIFTLLIIGALPFLCEYLKLERGYFAVGGEWLLPLLPVLAYQLKKTITEIFKELKDRGL